MDKERIKWIDVVKFFGIFAIYLGHITKDISYNIVFFYHVPLFFLISGCMENLNTERSFYKNLKKKIKSILIPFFIFSIITVCLVIMQGSNVEFVKSLIKTIIKGNARSAFIADPLWFLSCLFVMEILFSILKKVKFKTLILLICIVLHVIADVFIIPNSRVTQYFIYNIDSALYYIIYYAIGYIIFPFIKNLFELNTTKKKIVFMLSMIITSIYFFLLFLGIDFVNEIYNFGSFPLKVYNIIGNILRALMIIWFFFALSKIFENNKLLNKIGSETLYLCGNEYIIKTLFLSVVDIFGIRINVAYNVTYGINSYIYTFILILVAYKYLNPIQKNIVHRIQKLSLLRHVESIE